LKPEPGPTFIFKARVRPESQDMGNCTVSKKVVYRYSCWYMVLSAPH